MPFGARVPVIALGLSVAHSASLFAESVEGPAEFLRRSGRVPGAGRMKVGAEFAKRDRLPPGAPDEDRPSRQTRVASFLVRGAIGEVGEETMRWVFGH